MARFVVLLRGASVGEGIELPLAEFHGANPPGSSSPPCSAATLTLMQSRDRPATEPGDQFFRDLEVRRTRALVERDMETLEQLHAAEYQLVTPAGKVFTREAYLGAIESEPFYAAWQPLGEVSVRRSEAMAVVRYRVRLKFPSGRTVVCWHTDTYELRSSGWQAVWSQATELCPLAGSP